MPFTLIKNGCQYTITVKRVPYANCKDYIKYHKQYVTFLNENNILTKNKQRESWDILNDFRKHCSHATLHVSQLNLKTHEKHEYDFAITSKSNAVTIKPSLSEAMVGETAKSYPVRKIVENLYLTSHSIDNGCLKPESLIYDEDADRYKEMATNEPYNITQENFEIMSLLVVNQIESKNVEKIDITSKGDFKNDIVSSKMLEAFQKGQFDNKSYPEIDKELNIVDEKFFQLEIEFEKKFYNKNPTKINEE